MIKKKINEENLTIWTQTVEFSYFSEDLKRIWKEKLWIHCNNKKEAINLVNKFIANKVKQFNYIKLDIKLFKDLKNSKEISNSLFSKVYGQVINISE